MGNLRYVSGVPPLKALEGLTNSYKVCDSSPAVFDALIRVCTQIGDTDGAYEVIRKLRSKSYSFTIQVWNNLLSHLLKLSEIHRCWEMYREMISYGYSESVNTFNLVVYALSKECRLPKTVSIFYYMLKNGIWPNVVTFHLIIDGACMMGDLVLYLKLLRKIGSNGADAIPRVDEVGGSELTIETKITTLDSQTYTLRVDKQVPIPALKELIVSITNVLLEQQCLIGRRRVLKDDQLLSSYHVEDGYTLHLVVQHPFPPSSKGLPNHTATDPVPTTSRWQFNMGEKNILIFYPSGWTFYASILTMDNAYSVLYSSLGGT
ncbi:pentatricopeptide repeat-containing protein At1g11710, mitochondrial-like [Juglans microcarpa x Juglans regia]|uniref:pentatricopeptide repeat-containing protein At1g11710, mitochondrial-like n=1 Tax=Juglans microcarpa x Juglans regia TaxID=2249226 RepID=UPI001B7F40C3|nr:pentatricopeptide repeat-containing protein At1g11710, mitochondrial-like [Juglans microcarpa x Juglans regia]